MRSPSQQPRIDVEGAAAGVIAGKGAVGHGEATAVVEDGVAGITCVAFDHRQVGFADFVRQPNCSSAAVRQASCDCSSGAAQKGDTMTARNTTSTSVVLVHGRFADGFRCEAVDRVWRREGRTGEPPVAAGRT